MKYIVIGLGKLGKALAESFTTMGHDVIGVDHDMREVEAVKDTISTAICLDTQDVNAVKTLPLKDADAVYVTYGENFGGSVETAAVLKQLAVERLIVRSISKLQETVLRAIGVSEILSPEEEYAQEYAASLQLGDKLEHWYKVTPSDHLIRINLPGSLIGQRILDIDFKEVFNLKLIAILRPSTRKNIIGMIDKKLETLENIDEDETFNEGDKLVLFGKSEDYTKLNEV